jgi:hypothetical protein
VPAKVFSDNDEGHRRVGRRLRKLMTWIDSKEV